jgi:Tol biopolymer transport system component
VGSIDSSETKMLMKISSRVLYAPPGYLLYVREGVLLARPFDAGTLSFTGEEMTVVDRVGNFSSTGNAYFSVSANGEVLSYLGGDRRSQLIWLNRSGAQTGTIGEPAEYWLPRLSRDGKMLAVDLVDRKDATNDIWIYDLERLTFSRFTFDSGVENGSLWTPDRHRIVYARDRDGPPHLFQKSLDDSGEGEMLLPAGTSGAQYPYDFTPDGQFLLYREVRADTGVDLYLLPMSGDRTPRPFANTQFDESDARMSYDGKWVAYVSNQSGKREVYVQRLEGGERIQVSNGGGGSPHWRPDGRELYYVAGQKVIAVPVTPGDKFQMGTAVTLFTFDLLEFEVAPDGQRFLIRTNTAVPALPLSVATAWSANLKR